MALFHEGQPCPLCKMPMNSTDRLFATSHFLDQGSDLWRYSDAVIHWDCYATWEHRTRFGRLYFEAKLAWAARNSSWGIAHSDDRLLVSANPDRLVSEVGVALAETGSTFRIRLAEWQDWLNGEWEEDCQHAIERGALMAVLPLLRAKLPTARAVVEAAGMEAGGKSDVAAEGGIVARIGYEIACQALAEQALRKGIVCVGCGAHSTDYEYIRVGQVSESGPQSRLLCRRCGKEFGPLDVDEPI